MPESRLQRTRDAYRVKDFREVAPSVGCDNSATPQWLLDQWRWLKWTGYDTRRPDLHPADAGDEHGYGAGI